VGVFALGLIGVFGLFSDILHGAEKALITTTKAASDLGAGLGLSGLSGSLVGFGVILAGIIAWAIIFKTVMDLIIYKGDIFSGVLDFIGEKYIGFNKDAEASDRERAQNIELLYARISDTLTTGATGILVALTAAGLTVYNILEAGFHGLLFFIYESVARGVNIINDLAQGWENFQAFLQGRDAQEINLFGDFTTQINNLADAEAAALGDVVGRQIDVGKMMLDTTKEIIESSHEIEKELLKSIERENELALIQKNINSLTEERANLLETVATLEKSIQATEPFKEDLPEQYASYVSLLDKTKKELDETESSLNNWQRQLSLANGYTEDILNAIDSQSTKQNELNALVEKQATLTKNIAEFDETFGEDASKFKTYSELNTELSETNNKISTLEKDLSGLTSKISSFTSANKTMLDEFDKSILDRELSFISFDFEGAIQKDMESIKAAASTAGKALSEELTNSINEELTTQKQTNIFNGGAL
jgi:hypothetical protein